MAQFGLTAKRKTPEALEAEALKGFTDALQKLEDAHTAVTLQAAEHQKTISEAHEKLLAANQTSSRLSRIKDRFADLIA